GCGWAQRQGGTIEEIKPGDVVWFPPGEKHWHGATPTTASARGFSLVGDPGAILSNSLPGGARRIRPWWITRCV
ncbi:MAG: hypothetical protein WCD29_19345, partial [Pseudolabrys sp.]